MCRLMAASATSLDGVNQLSGLLPAFYNAASNDHRLAALTGGEARHCHGYGYILLVDYGQGWEIHYHRVDTAQKYGPGEQSCKANLQRLRSEIPVLQSRLKHARQAILLIHSRRASRGAPRGPQNAHPFNAKAILENTIIEIYLAHNGSIYHQQIARELGIQPSRITDSHALTLWIAKQIQNGSQPLEALRKGSIYTKRAYIVPLLTIQEDKPILYYSTYMPENLDQTRKQYYKTYIIESNNLKAIASGTIIDYIKHNKYEIKEPDTFGVLT